MPTTDPTDAELRRLARERMSADPHPDLIEAFPNRLARTLAVAKAAGLEVPTDEGARGKLARE